MTVAEFDPPRRMVWKGGLSMGLFRGERIFALTLETPDSVEFWMEERYTGLMAPFITRSIPGLQPAFEEFAKDLKRAAEGT
jgi:hypothetical protein